MCVCVNIARVIIIIINLSNILNFYFFTKINLNLKGKNIGNSEVSNSFLSGKIYIICILGKIEVRSESKIII